MICDGFFTRLLVPVDGSDSARLAARYAMRLACRQGCEVVALHVVDEENAADLARFDDRPVESMIERMKVSGEACLEELREMARSRGVSLRTEVRVGIPARIILKTAREKGIDLIVMGTVGRRGPRRVLLGSVTERVIEHSTVPVLVVKSGQVPDRED